MPNIYLTTSDAKIFSYAKYFKGFSCLKTDIVVHVQ